MHLGQSKHCCLKSLNCFNVLNTTASFKSCANINQYFHISFAALHLQMQQLNNSTWSKCYGLRRPSRVSPQQILTTVMTNIVVDKNTYNAEPLSICFLPQYSTPKKIFISSERDQNHDTKKEQALSITFSKYDWFISQNGRS